MRAPTRFPNILPAIALLAWFAQAGTAQSAPEPYDIGRGGFAPSGWMGDGEHGGFASQVSTDKPPAGTSSRKWIYTPKEAGWGGVAYQYPPDNWGDSPGRNLNGKGYTELSVWARGVAGKNGHYPMIVFKAGTNPDTNKRKYRDSFEAEGEFVTLTGSWVRYNVSLAKKNLSNVVNAFSFTLRAEDNPEGAVFFLSGIEYR